MHVAEMAEKIERLEKQNYAFRKMISYLADKVVVDHPDDLEGYMTDAKYQEQDNLHSLAYQLRHYDDDEYPWWENWE